jgi:hypothetical protein
VTGALYSGILGTGGTGSTSINSSILGLILSSLFRLLKLTTPLSLLLTLSPLLLGAVSMVSSELDDQRDCCFEGEGVAVIHADTRSCRIPFSSAISAREVLYLAGEVGTALRMDDRRRWVDEEEVAGRW